MESWLMPLLADTEKVGTKSKRTLSLTDQRKKKEMASFLVNEEI